MDALPQKIMLEKLTILQDELEKARRFRSNICSVGAKIYPILQKVDDQFAAQFYQSLHFFNLGLSGTTLAPAYDVMRNMVQNAIAKLNLDIEIIDAAPEDRYYSPNSPFDIQVDLARVMRTAKDKLWVFDPFADEKTLEEVVAVLVQERRILTANPKPLLVKRLAAFRKQYPKQNIEVRRDHQSHDRFYIVDESMVWTLGTSLNQAGKRATRLAKIKTDKEAQAITSDYKNWWAQAPVV